jgi:hypothetical protein
MQLNKYIVKLLFTSLLLVNLAYAAEFNATVEDNNIKFGQSLQLKLSLTDATASDALDLSPLAKDFIIYQQQQFSHYANVNGTVTAEKGWQVVLMPKNTGNFTIPSLQIKTNRGVLATQPIAIDVQAVKPGDKPVDDTAGVSMVAMISKDKAYIQEPVIYSLKLISYKPILNIVLEDLKSTDAIIEKVGDPKQYDQTLGGVRAHIIEIIYAITPLHAGAITINPAMMHGEMQIQVAQSQQAQRFGIFNNLFNNPVIELRPFSLQSEAITLQALPVPLKTQNWLPSYNLTISESLDAGQNVKVGDTITRKIKMVARGNFGSQLPSVKDYMQSDQYKLYANKPILSTVLDSTGQTIIGTKEEEYSLVPQQPGKITLPAIKITWWNLRTKKLETSTLPAKTIQVAPAVANATSNDIIDYSGTVPATIQATEAQPQTTAAPKSNFMLIILGALAGVLLSLLGVGCFWLIKRWRQKVKVAKPAELVIDSPAVLRQVIVQHASKHWHIAPEVPLNRLGDALTANNYTYDVVACLSLSQDLNAAMYASARKDLDQLIALWEQFKASVTKLKTKTQHTANNEDYSSLNPT